MTRRRPNPPKGHVIGDQVEAIYYRKGQPHECNAGCKRANHRYVHRFSRRHKFPLIGLPNGQLLI